MEVSGVQLDIWSQNIPTIPTVVLTTNLPVLIPALVKSPWRRLLGIVTSDDKLSTALPVPALTGEGKIL